MLESFFNKVAVLQVWRTFANDCICSCLFIKKETLTQVFSCEFCKIFKNTFFTELLRTTASADDEIIKWNFIFKWKTYKKKCCIESILFQKHKGFNKIYIFKNKPLIISKLCNFHGVCRRSWSYQRYYWR